MRKFVDFLKKDIWHYHLDELSIWKRFGVRSLRILVLTSHGFSKRQIQQGASSLTYYTLLSAVPILAFAVALMRGFLLENWLKKFLVTRLDHQKLVVEKLLSFAELSITQAGKGVVAGIGIVIIIWAALKILIYLEMFMNRIWEVKIGRPLARRFSDYLALIFLCPVFLLVSSSLTVYLSSLLTDLGKESQVFRDIGPLIYAVFNLFPLVLAWILLTFIYIFIPNTRVHLLPAFWAGLITGTCFQVLQWAYFYLQLGVSHYSTVYGAFAAIPLFLIWVHLSWVFVLMGAKLSFAFQNSAAFEFIADDIELNHQYRMILAVRVMHLCVQRFSRELPPLTRVEISSVLAIPLPLTVRILYSLIESGLLVEVNVEKKHNGYQPAVIVDKLTIKYVINKVNDLGAKIPLPETKEVRQIIESFHCFSELMEKSDANLLLRDL